MNILQHIPYGHENAISRQDLVEESGLSDRKVRLLIEIAVRTESIVVNMNDGYFQYKDDSDIPYLESYYRREMARGWSIINKCKVIRKFLNTKKNRVQAEDNQISIFDFMGRDA